MTLKHECRAKLQKQGFSDSEIDLESFLHLRYDGTDCALMCSAEKSSKVSPEDGDFETKFLNR